MARPISYNRDQIVDRAMRLFWQEGLTSTSLRRVLDVTGFNRHSLYQEFGGMDGLFTAALEHYHVVSEQLWMTLEHGPQGLAAIRTVFRMRLSADLAGTGCFASMTLMDDQEVCKEALVVAERYWRRVENGIARCVRQAQAVGDISPEKDARVMAKFVVSVLHGLSPLSKSRVSRAQLNAIADMTLDALKC